METLRFWNRVFEPWIPNVLLRFSNLPFCQFGDLRPPFFSHCFLFIIPNDEQKMADSVAAYSI